jgi:hypothetical protein
MLSFFIYVGYVKEFCYFKNLIGMNVYLSFCEKKKKKYFIKMKNLLI